MSEQNRGTGLSRRDAMRAAALGTVAAGTVALGSPKVAWAGPGGPVAIATWRHGVPAVARSGEILGGGGTALDAAEAGVMVSELDPAVTSVGYGGRPNRDGIVELDACLMDGRTRELGAVASLRGCKTPIAVARRVMEKTPHVLLVGEGARRFATAEGFADEDLLTEGSRAAWERWKERQRAPEPPPANEEEAEEADRPPAEPPAKQDPGNAEDHDTIGLLALDGQGDLAAACTTSGLAWKLPGRVGDSPIVGAGLYAENGVGAATATGVGEEVLKVCGSFVVVERMRAGDDPTRACEVALERILERNPAHAKTQLAFLALRADGAIGAASMTAGFTYGLWRGSETGAVAQEVKVAAFR